MQYIIGNSEKEHVIINSRQNKTLHKMHEI